MYTISKQFTFSASHQLENLPSNHPCRRLHGHNYRVELILQAKFLNDAGFVEDYRDLDAFKEFLDRTFDHRHLNDIIPQPTAERLAAYLYERAWPLCMAKLVAVRVSETEKTWAEYRPEE